MNKLCVFALIFCLMGYCFGTEHFDCGDVSSAACKIKFGEQYERLFKEMHLGLINDLYTSIKSILTNILNELPKDDAISIKIKYTLKKLSDNIELLNANKDDNQKIAEIIEDMLRCTDWGHEDFPSISIYESLAKKYQMMEIISKIYYSFINDVAKLYTDMYAGLREIDLKDYPEYDKLNLDMNNIQSHEDDPKNILAYGSIKEYIGATFNLPYITAVTDSI